MRQTMNILNELAEAAAARVTADRQRTPVFEHFPEAVPFAFENALRSEGMSFICEVKKASPSKGVIAEDFPFIQIAEEYEAAGASCISVLTEPDRFLGRDEHLVRIKERVSVPILRKDFTVDEYQLYQARAMGADAILLICALLDQTKIRKYLETADGLGLSCLVEAHDEREIETAVRAGARIIGVNNRDLKTFQVDLRNSVRLRKLVPDDVLFVSESGISSPEEIRLLAENRVDAVLIGESLMRSADKKAFLDHLRGGCRGQN
ncbi:MAG: indole-3-glycerol phosphate synthase TrpC [Methanomassiliicoccaceae archaeon]|nr:indole-3-glycerol phosphate synthase TrpC [Methanomassiliicoccaceae archaeon]MCL2145715.1 indole-3-glycerol phosphate synthase TrpC [Methanomassiliicoccaceae archaeon]